MQMNSVCFAHQWATSHSIQDTNLPHTYAHTHVDVHIKAYIHDYISVKKERTTKEGKGRHSRDSEHG